jgi:hypothetical protein
MRRLLRCVVLIPILLLGAACDDSIPGAQRNLTVAEAAPAEALEP